MWTLRQRVTAMKTKLAKYFTSENFMIYGSWKVIVAFLISTFLSWDICVHTQMDEKWTVRTHGPSVRHTLGALDQVVEGALTLYPTTIRMV